MRIQVYTDLAELPETVAARFSHPAQTDFFLTREWFTCLYDKALRDELTPRLYLVSDTRDQPLALFVCAVKPGERTLRSLTNFYSLAYAPVPLAPGPLVPLCEAFAAFVAAERPRWQTATLRLMDSRVLQDSGLAAALRRHGFRVREFFQYENWYLTVGDRDFATYYAGLSSRLRNTVKRKEKKLAKAHDYRIAIHTEPGPALQAATDDYIAIYNSSWKRPEPYPAFIPGLVDSAAALGILRLGVLHIDDRPAAAQLWLTSGGRAIIYKLAYDEAYAEYSPGSILSRELFRQAIDDDQVHEIDYGIGGEGYKKDWMSAVREIRGLQAHNTRTLQGAVLAGIEALKSATRGLRRPG